MKRKTFNELNNTCIIMITPFDLFGEGCYCYTFRERCDENEKLALNLRDFLHYIE